MCGRFTIRKPVTKTVDIVKTSIKVEDSDNYNAHPTQKLPIIKSYTNGKALELCEWGLVPTWSKKLDKFSPLINARKETLMEKVTFKNLIQTSRCIVPADGYYEWKKSEGVNVPYYIYRKDHQLLLFVGIWQQLIHADMPTINCCTIVTCPASDPLDKIHGRMPLFTDSTAGMHWLIHSPGLDGCHSLLQSCSGKFLQMHTVHTQVNHVGFEHPSCVDPASFHRQKSLF